MPGRRVLLTAPPGDALLDWLRSRLAAAGYETTIMAGEPAPISLTPIVAGFDLWHGAGEERFEAIADLDEALPPGRPLLALCHALSAGEAAAFAVHGARVVGFSLFGPPREGALVELLPALVTEPAAVERAADIFRTIGLSVQSLPAGSWAIYPRVISMIVNEAATAIMEGTAPADDIDTAMTLGLNIAQGPLALADEIGLDEILAVIEALQGEYGDERYRPAPLLRRLVLAGYTGKRAGRGFHRYG